MTSLTKRFYTSYYRKSGRETLAIRTSASAPSYFTGLYLPQLYPTWEIIDAWKAKEVNWGQYATLYRELLYKRGVDFQELHDTLPDGSIFCCWEEDDVNCHRSLIAGQFHLIGVEVYELGQTPVEKLYGPDIISFDD